MHHRPGEGEAIAVADRIHHPEVDIGDMAQIAAAAGQREQVAGMGIGMEIAEFQQLLQAGDHAGADQGGGVEALGFQFTPLLKFGAIHPGGGQHPAAAEAALHRRHRHGGIVGEKGGETLGVVGFPPVINLLEETAAEFIDDLPKPEAEIEGQHGSAEHGQHADQHKIAAQLELQLGSLHLHRHPVAAVQPCFVHLAQTGGRHRMLREAREQLVGRRPQLGFDHGQGDGVGVGRQVVLETGQLIEPVAPHEIRAGGEGLPHLDEAGAEPGEGGADLHR